jgi:uncharacterized protein YggU (UPF0235/DUF167 family)
MARVEITVSPGAARTELVELVADLAGVRREKVTVVAGAHSRHKVLEVDGLGADELDRRLAAASHQDA